jgi:hypothetical protein
LVCTTGEDAKFNALDRFLPNARFRIRLESDSLVSDVVACAEAGEARATIQGIRPITESEDQGPGGYFIFLGGPNREPLFRFFFAYIKKNIRRRIPLW